MNRSEIKAYLYIPIGFERVPCKALHACVIGFKCKMCDGTGYYLMKKEDVPLCDDACGRDSNPNFSSKNYRCCSWCYEKRLMIPLPKS